MHDNSFEWFSAQIENVRQHVDRTWPQWMKNTSDVATASFPVVSSGRPPQLVATDAMEHAGAAIRQTKIEGR